MQSGQSKRILLLNITKRVEKKKKGDRILKAPRSTDILPNLNPISTIATYSTETRAERTAVFENRKKKERKKGQSNSPPWLKRQNSRCPITNILSLCDGDTSNRLGMELAARTLSAPRKGRKKSAREGPGLDHADRPKKNSVSLARIGNWKPNAAGWKIDSGSAFECFSCR